LETLEVSQTASIADDANLPLSRVDFTTPQGIARYLPVRIAEIGLRPYPWEVNNLSQLLGLAGTLFILVGFFFLGREVLRHRGELMQRAGPLIYIGLSLLIAYAMASGNAGTAFRYRVQIVAVGICVVSSLALAHRSQRQPELVKHRSREDLPLHPGIAHQA
jgi:hypothetical protein